MNEQVAIPGMGHNRGPLIDPEMLAREQTKVTSFADAAGSWLDRKEIKTEAEAEELNDFLTGAARLSKEIDAARMEAKRPYMEAANQIQKTFTDLTGTLALTAGKVRPIFDTYIRAKKAAAQAAQEEARRIAREEEKAAQAALAASQARNDVLGEQKAIEAQKAAEKTARAAEKPVKAQVGSASGGGRTMSLRIVRTARILNIRVAFLAVMGDPAVVDAVQSALNRIIRAKGFEGTVAGIEIITEEKAA